MKTSIIILLTTIFITYACNYSPVQRKTSKEDWKTEVEETLKMFGHRNWIVIADAAYPQQSNPAIKTMIIDAKQLEAVKMIKELIKKATHVDANIFVDKELDFVTEDNAEGIGAYRDELDKILSDVQTRSLLHENIIRELDESAKLFNVLILKTDLAIPYTSVFFQLECGYWNAESEKDLRDELNNVN